MICGKGVNKKLVRMGIVEEALYHMYPFDNMIGYWKMTSPHICPYAGELDAIYHYVQSCTQIIRTLARFYSYDYGLRKTNYIFK